MSVPNQRRIPTHTIAITGLLLALTIIMGLVPSIGFIPVPPAGATIMAIPLLIGLYMEGQLVGFMLALGFGLFSMYQSFTAPVSPIAFVFLNPLVAVLPRLLIVPAAHYTFKGVNALFGGKKRMVATGVGAVVGSVTNTVGVLTMIYICYADGFAQALALPREGVIVALGAIALSNGIWEAALAAVITVTVTGALNKALHKNVNPNTKQR